MIRILYGLIIIICLSCSSTLLAAEQTFILDPEHTYVLWHVNHFGFSHPCGKWMATGTLVLDKDKPQNSRVNASIQMANVVTGIPELDQHLKEKLFFDTNQFPTATFASNKVEIINKNKAHVQGILTLHGISKPVTLDVTLNKADVSLISNKMTAGFTANTMIKRSDFGITTLLPGVSDEVKIDIESEAYLKG